MALKEISREDFKKQKAAKTEENKEQKLKETGKKRVRVRLIPIPVRLLIIAVLIVVCFAAGTSVGYGVLGGEQATDVLKKSTWTHILDLMNRD